MKTKTLVASILIGSGISIAGALGSWCIYASGRASAQRECPSEQRGERLLSSEQRRDMTVCFYAAGPAGYGRTIKSKRSRS
jgi:hypothetical protein